MEDALQVALITERAVLRKDIRRMQAESVRLNQQVADLEVQLRTIEESVDSRDSLQTAVQQESATGLEQRIAEQQAWNRAFEARLQKQCESLDRKRRSHEWMRETSSFLRTELLAFLDDVTNAAAIQRSQDISDRSSLEQLDARLSHRQFALLALSSISIRHTTALKAQGQMALEQRFQIHEGARTKLRALEHERSKLIEDFQRADEVSRRKKQNQGNMPVRPAATRSKPSAEAAENTCVPRAPMSFEGLAESRGPSPEVRRPSPTATTTSATSRGAKRDNSLKRSSSSTGEGSPRPSTFTSIANYNTKFDAYDAAAEVASTEQHLDDAVFLGMQSAASTPRYSRGSITPRTATPKLTNHTSRVSAANNTRRPSAASSGPPSSARSTPIVATPRERPRTAGKTAAHTAESSKGSLSSTPSVAVSNLTQYSAPARYKFSPREAAVLSASSLKKAVMTAPPLISRLRSARQQTGNPYA